MAELLGIQLTWQGESPEVIPGSIRKVFIMVARETIANAVKHAEAKKITIGIHKKDARLLIEISNEVNEHFNMILDLELADWRGKNKISSNRMVSIISAWE